MTTECSETSGEGEPLSADRARSTMRGIATVDYMVPCRPGLVVTARVLSQSMASPIERTQLFLNGFVRYLSLHLRRILRYPQGEVDEAPWVWPHSVWIESLNSRRSCIGATSSAMAAPYAVRAKLNPTLRSLQESRNERCSEWDL